jgi:hypothetical protein
MEPRMKAEISPLCLHHDKRGPMFHVRDGFACKESGCNLHYSPEHGYRESVDENTFKPSTNTKRCTQCDQFQYLAKRGEIRMDDEYHCPNAACPSKR